MRKIIKTWWFILLNMFTVSKSIKVLSLYYHEQMGKVKEHKGKKYLIVYYCILDKVLGKIKK